jgi:hypothetical protein
MGTGFMKCVETTREEALVSVGSLVVDAAIRVIEMEEVFVARIVCGGQICARELKMENFKEGISGTASITKSAEERSSILVVGVRRERILSDWSCVMRCLVTSLARSLSGVKYKLARYSWRKSNIELCCQVKTECMEWHTGKREAFIKGGLICIHESDRHTGFLCCY